MNTTFKQAMQNAGIEPPEEIIADSTLHRFNIPGDRPQSKNGWYVLYADGLAAGSFGCWKRGISETWSDKTYQTLTPAEQTAYTAKMEAMKRQREEERARIQDECRAWSTGVWNNSEDATNDNPYLKRMGVNSFGLKSFKDILLVPVQDMQGTIHGIQFISPDGSKKFKTGTNKVGHFFKIGESNDGIIIVCEGYATGASIHQATGHDVAIAFDAGNLLSVAQCFHSKDPRIIIILAADDDHATEGNPGLSKATEAALAVNGLLAIPIFPNDRGQKDTDFNDLARLMGLDSVKVCIEAADMPSPASVTDNPIQAESASITNAFDARIQRLASLSPIQYDQVRKAEAKALGIRAITLDDAVKDVRPESDNEDLPFKVVEPWPEPIDPAKLLTDIAVTIRRFIVCTEEVVNAVALWVAMTWFIVVVRVAPLAAIISPEKRCGKSILLSLFGRLSARSITASSISPAALFRSIEAWSPSLMIDEADSFMKDNEELRGLLNSGHTRDSAYVIRTVGESFTPTKFSTWGAKAIACIGHLADTIMDRSVVLGLRRKLSSEKVERIRDAEPGLFDELCSKLARFAEDYSEDVRDARPPLPESLHDRAQDNWEPLLAIAMIASEEWLKIGTTAALKLTGGEIASPTIGTELLSDIQEIFKKNDDDRISTADLISNLCRDNEKRWLTYNKGLYITSRQLAEILRRYDIRSKTIRFDGSTAKGYEESQFTDTFSRYVSITPSPSVTTSQDSNISDLDNSSPVTPVNNVTDENRPNPLIINACDAVTDKSQKKGPLQTEIASPHVGNAEDLKELTI